MDVWGIAEGRIRRLEREQTKKAGIIRNQDDYQFIISPTCPPSTNLVFRGGLAWWTAAELYPAGFYIPNYTIDITDPDKVSVRAFPGYTYTFTNAYWYAPCVIGLASDVWPPPEPPDTWPTEPPNDILFLYGDVASPYLAEFETAVEAEDFCREIRGDIATQYGIIMSGLILRNNGNTIDPNQYQAIDAVNRGRSYLFGGRRSNSWKLG